MKNIPYGKHEITDEDIAAVTDVLKNKNLTQGEEVGLFEEAVKTYVGCREAVAVNSATSALHIACIAIEIGKDELVWTTPITFVASANCALYCGCKIDFVDIDDATGLIDCNKLEKKLEIARSREKLPSALIAVHLAGSSCDMARICELSKEFGFKIIEDASHAIGGEYKQKKIGSCQYSDITVFSFHPVKIITTGEGGMATTNNKLLAEKMRLARSHGIIKPTTNEELEEKGGWYYEQILLGYNYRMNDIQASLGRSQLSRIDKFMLIREEIRSKYERRFKETETFKLLQIPQNVKSSNHLVIIQMKDELRDRYKEIFTNIRREGIGIQLHYMPVHLHPYYRKIGFKEGNFPIAENYSMRALSIPIYTTLKATEQDYVTEKLLNIIK